MNVSRFFAALAGMVFLCSRVALPAHGQTAPAAPADAYWLNQSPSILVSAPGVLANDSGTGLTAVLDVPPSNAEVFDLQADGSFVYTAIRGFGATDSFWYHTTNGSSSSSSIQVTLDVQASGAGFDDPRESESFTFAVIGDYGDVSLNGGADAQAVASMIDSWSPDFVMTTGDNNYENGEANSIDQNIGSLYGPFIFPYTGSYGSGADFNRFFPTIGNHDYETDDAQPYLDYLTLPGEERFYKFSWGPVEFFTVSSDIREFGGTSSGIEQSEQYLWLQSELENSTAAWKVVFIHHPPIVSRTSYGSEHMRWPFAEWGANLLLAGHSHVYERLDFGGIPLIVNGMGGRPLFDFTLDHEESLFQYNESHGAQRITATDCTLSLAFHSVYYPSTEIDPIELDRCTTSAPTAVDDDYMVVGGQVLDVNVLSNDLHPAGATAVLLSSDADDLHYTFNMDGELVFNPAVGSPGMVHFTYEIHYLDLVSEPASVTVTVLNSPDDLCYFVADNENIYSHYNNDVVTSVLLATGVETVIGNTGTTGIEGMAINPATSVIYAADGGTIGTINPGSGLFTVLGIPGLAIGPEGPIDVTDLDGLSFDPTSSMLYATHSRTSGGDLLIRINPANGSLVEFSAGVEYRVMAISRVDDIAIGRFGQAYAVHHTSDSSTLYELNLGDGTVSNMQTLSMRDIEGLSFAPNGTLIGSEGNYGRRLWLIDPSTGATTNPITLGRSDNGDYEAVDCIGGAVPPAPEIDLSLAVNSPGPQIVGNTFDATFTLSNTSFDPASNVEVTIEVLSGLWIDGEGDATSTTVDVDALGAYASVQLPLTLIADAVGDAVICAFVSAAAQADADSGTSAPVRDSEYVAEDDEICLTIPVRALEVDLSLTATALGPQIVGSTFDATFVLANEYGFDLASNIEITLEVLNGLWIDGMGVTTTKTVDVAALNPDSSIELPLTLVADAIGDAVVCAYVSAVDQADFDSGIAAPIRDGLYIPEDDEVCLTIPLRTVEIDLSLTANAPGPQILGNAFSASFALSNAAAFDDASNIQVTFEVLNGLWIDGLGTTTTKAVDVAALSADASIELPLILVADALGDAVVCAFVSAADQADVDSGTSAPVRNATYVAEDDEVCVTISVQEPPPVIDLSMLGTAPTPHIFGSTFDATFTLSNALGFDAASNVQVTFEVLNGLQIAGPGPATSASVDVAALDTEGSIELPLSLVAAAVGDAVVCAFVSAADQVDVDSGTTAPVRDPMYVAEDDEVCVTIHIDPTPGPDVDISVAATAPDSAPLIDSFFDITLTVTNESTNNADGILIAFPVPAGLWLTVPDGFWFEDNVLRWGVGSLDAGEVVSLTLELRADEPVEVDACAHIATVDQPDSNLENDEGCVLITVMEEAPNGAPEASDDEVSTPSGLAIAISPLVNDDDPDGDTILIESVFDPSNGTVSIDATSTMVIYTPADGFNGTDAFEYTISDPDGATASATVTIVVESDPSSMDICYLVADNGEINSGSLDVLTVLVNGIESVVGATGTTDIEAIARDPFSGTLFAADGGTIGTLDLATGTFTELDTPGSGNGANGIKTFNDIDGLAFDPIRNVLFASSRTEGDSDALFQINLDGSLVTDAFGPGLDYVLIAIDDNVDDIAINPNTGEAVTMHDNGSASVVYALNLQTGAVTQGPALSERDIEGLAFAKDGSLVGSQGARSRVLWTIGTDGTLTLRGALGAGYHGDYEAVDCVVEVGDPVPAVDLNLELTVDEATPLIDTFVVVTLKLTNESTELDATETSVTIAAPSGLWWDALNLPAGTALVGDTLVWSPGTLALGGTMATLELTLRADAVGATEVCGVASATEFERNLYDNHGCVAVNVLPIPVEMVDLSLNISAPNTAPQIDSFFDITVELSNESLTDANGITVTLPVPDGLWLTVPDGMSFEYNALTWDIGSLAAGERAELALELRADALVEANVCASVSAVDPADSNADNDTGCVLITVTPDPSSMDICYLVADNGEINSGSLDVLTVLVNGIESVVGATGTTDIEAIARDPFSGTLFAADGGTIGTLDLATGTFTELDTPGSGNGANGIKTFNDIDGLAFDPIRNVLFASSRTEGDSDALFQINLDGSLVTDAFGPGLDYVLIAIDDNVDDIAINPNTGEAVTMHDNGSASVVYALNLQTGAVTQGPALSERDIEGLAFAKDGSLVGSQGARSRVLWTIGTDGTLTLRGALGAGYHGDYEAVDCVVEVGDPVPAVDLNLELMVDEATPLIDTFVVVTLKLTNESTELDATETSVTIAAPSGLWWDALNLPAGTALVGDELVWSPGTLALGGTMATLELTLRADAAGATEVCGVTAGAEPDHDLSDNQSCVAVDVVPAPRPFDLVLAIASANDAPVADTPFDLVLTITNTGTDEATNVDLTFDVPAGLWLQDSTPSLTGTLWSIASIPAGDSATLTLNLVGEQGDVDVCAAISASDQTDVDPSNNQACIPIHVQEAPEPPDASNVCYLVADNDGAGANTSSSRDRLVAVFKSDNTEVAIGFTGTTSIEAIAFDPFGGLLYATDDGALGIIDVTTGVFSGVGSAGIGNGPLGSLAFDDIDGITFDPNTGALYGSVHRDGSDVLVRLDPASGAAMPAEFGTDDYLVIGGASEIDIDDLAIDPVSGRLLAIVDFGHEPSTLVEINRADGSVTHLVTLDTNKIEGLTFDGDGTLIASIGSSAKQVVTIDRATGATTLRTTLGVDGNQDYEAIDCLTNIPNEVSVRVVDYNGMAAAGVAVEMYRDLGGDGYVDSVDMLLLSDHTSDDGSLEIRAASSGSFVLRIEGSDVPAHFDGFGQAQHLGDVAITTTTSTANEGGEALPDAFRLVSTYPNPFNPQATISIELPETARVRLSVFDMLGREVAVLIDGMAAAGAQTVTFDADGMSSGTYVVRFVSPHGSSTRSITLLR